MAFVPGFYDPDGLADLRLERTGQIAAEALTWKKTRRIAPAGTDSFRVAAFGIDCQLGFIHPEGSLSVPGAIDDSRRTLEWLYANIDKITGLYFSLDTHQAYQIFFPAYWRDQSGAPPPPLTVITPEDIETGSWMPTRHAREAIEYTQNLAAAGKYVLTIWPYHALMGGLSHALLPAFMEAALFHALLRDQETHFETKGTHPMTENYSVLSPEVTELGGQSVGAFNRGLFETLMEYDRIYIFGQAKSHCVLSTLVDLRTHIETSDPSLLDKIWILEDATSPVPAPPLDPLPPALDFPKVAETAFLELQKAGMHLVKTSDPITLP